MPRTLRFATLGLILLASSALADDDPVTMKIVPYRGWKNAIRLANGDAELVVTVDVGPRVISYRLAGGTNVFKEYDDQIGKEGEPDWRIRGGHRLWVAPEDPKRTYTPDNAPIMFEEADAGGIRVRGRPDNENGLLKEMEIRLADTGSGVRIVHRIRNIGKGPTELAPWSISVMKPGGVEIIPMPPSRPHPGPPTGRTPADFAPDRTLVLWPFFDFTDKRYAFGQKYILLRQDRKKGPTEIGLAHRMGWVGYLNDETLFVKRFDYKEGAPYTDNGCNFETFTNEDMLEVETLGPVAKLAPGAAVEHVERWDLIPKVGYITAEEHVDAKVLPKIPRD